MLSLHKPSIDQLLRYPALGVTTTAANHPLNVGFNAAEINRQVVCSELSTLLAIVKKTNAWLLATEDQIADASSQELSRLQIAGFQPTSDLSIIECQGRSKSPAAATFIKACFDKLSRIDE